LPLKELRTLVAASIAREVKAGTSHQHWMSGDAATSRSGVLIAESVSDAQKLRRSRLAGRSLRMCFAIGFAAECPPGAEPPAARRAPRHLAGRNSLASIEAIAAATPRLARVAGMDGAAVDQYEAQASAC
jgi:hypothetical protein